MVEDVWFGIYAPPEGCDFEHIRRVAKEAERTGFDIITITDHFMNMRARSVLDK